MRHTRKVSVWPVGLVGYLRYESPIIKMGKVSLIRVRQYLDTKYCRYYKSLTSVLFKKLLFHPKFDCHHQKVGIWLDEFLIFDWMLKYQGLPPSGSRNWIIFEIVNNHDLVIATFSHFQNIYISQQHLCSVTWELQYLLIRQLDSILKIKSRQCWY